MRILTHDGVEDSGAGRKGGVLKGTALRERENGRNYSYQEKKNIEKEEDLDLKLSHRQLRLTCFRLETEWGDIQE